VGVCARIEGAFVSYRRIRKGRASDASAEVVFERALLGDDASDRKTFDPREDRKTLQLCRQVQRALMLALSGECADDILREVYVESVEPMGGASQLLVRVMVPGELGESSFEVVARLEDRLPKLRALVARSICRKRVPNLMFVAIPAGMRLPEGGQS
jgi:ribosome-binding factor A